MRTRPKFELVNELLSAVDLDAYDYLLIVDDDVVLPAEFLDYFLGVQRTLGFALAQPARTLRSTYDLPIVQQQQGIVARETLFVEIGPVLSAHRSVFHLVTPFDLRSPMGWGYENVWSLRLAALGMKMGIVDAVPIDHSIRPSVTYYKWADADRGRQAFLEQHPHRAIEECFTVVDAISADDFARRLVRHATAN